MGAPVLMLELGNLQLDLNDVDSTGFLIGTVDLGYAPPRVVTTDLPEQDGADDQTEFFTARTVQLTGAVVPTVAGWSRTKAKDKLAPFLAAKARPTLHYALDADVDVRCLGLRIGQWSNPIDHPGNATAFSVQWVCPDPIAYGKSTNEVILPTTTGSTGGFSFPLHFPIHFPRFEGSTSSGIIFNVGTYQSWPLLRIYGPCTDPAVVWIDPVTGLSTGTQVVFSGLTIDAGDYVEVDTRAHTARLNGSVAANRYSTIDFAATLWGPLTTGPNPLRFTAAAASSDCVCHVLWRDAFLD
jgi:hypothetical protein